MRKTFLKYSIYLLLTLPILLSSCNNEDDVNEIFVSRGTWYVVNYYTGVNWDSNNDRDACPVITDMQELQVIQQFNITFKDDGTLEGNMQNATFTGYWQANGEDRSVSITRLKASTNKVEGRNKEFIETLERARFYQGDSGMLRLAPQERTTCIQFTHIKQNGNN